MVFYVWLNLTGGVAPRPCAVVPPIAYALLFNTGWIVLWILMHSGGIATAADGYVLPWFALQMATVPLLPCLARRFLRVVTFRPVLFGNIMAVLAIINTFIISTILSGLFNRSGDGVRILIRLVALPLLMEGTAVGIRFATQRLLHGSVPGATRGFLLLPLVLANAFIGRFFSTGLNSQALSYPMCCRLL